MISVRNLEMKAILKLEMHFTQNNVFLLKIQLNLYRIRSNSTFRYLLLELEVM